jgi:MFS transporter, DHA2 family, multidrug resistance protein
VVAAAGLGLFTQLDASAGPSALVPALVVVVAGLAPLTAIGANLIISAAPPEQAGAVSGLGQAGNELGGALGIAVLGSIGTAIYRADVADAVGSGVSPTAADAARDTLGGAVSVTGQLPAEVLDAAATAFTHGMHVAAWIAAALMVATAAMTAITLRRLPAAAPGAAEQADAVAIAGPLPEAA